MRTEFPGWRRPRRAERLARGASFVPALESLQSSETQISAAPPVVDSTSRKHGPTA